MSRFGAVRAEVGVAYLWLVVVVVGWWIGSFALALVGVLGIVCAAALWLWDRECLAGVSYRRTLGQRRANFGERVEFDVEVVNDKLLPISWLRAEDDVPSLLQIDGGTVLVTHSYVDTLVHLFPMLPYQRIRSHLSVLAVHRGEFIFGPVKVSSGDPVGLRTRTFVTADIDHLLVYPKVFALAPASITSRALLGAARARDEVLIDPSRVAGVREYRTGDPLRFVDWRATARSTSILVREFEPSVTPRVAVFLDFKNPTLNLNIVDAPELEFTVAVAASIVTELVGRKVVTGLYSSGAVAGGPFAIPPSSSPAVLPAMLEALARAVPASGARFSELLVSQISSLQRGTSVVLVASEFSEQTRVAVAELRRHHSVTAVWIEIEGAVAPTPTMADVVLRARYSDDWQHRQVLELD